MNLHRWISLDPKNTQEWLAQLRRMRERTADLISQLEEKAHKTREDVKDLAYLDAYLPLFRELEAAAKVLPFYDVEANLPETEVSFEAVKAYWSNAVCRVTYGKIW